MIQALDVLAGAVLGTARLIKHLYSQASIGVLSDAATANFTVAAYS